MLTFGPVTGRIGENSKDYIKKVSRRAKKLLLKGQYRLSNLTKPLPGFRISSKAFGTRFWICRESEREGGRCCFCVEFQCLPLQGHDAEIHSRAQWQPIRGTAALNLV